MILIDTNETFTSGIPDLIKYKNLPHVIIPNQGFDYIIDNVVAVERKTASDYIQSKQTGHLDKQLYEMSHNFALSYLVIYGDTLNTIIEHNLTRKMYISSLIGSSLKHSPDGKQGQIITINDTALFTEEDFVLFLECLNSKIQNQDFTRLPRIERHNLSTIDQKIKILTSFPSIGEKRAKDIINKYVSLQNFFSAIIYTPENVEVKGLPKEVVKNINKIITQSD